MPERAVADRLAAVQATIRQACAAAGRPSDAVRLIAVSKTMPVPLIREAIAAGVTDLGENRVQEGQEKIPALADARVRWHLIGHLQSNKAARALDLFTMIQAVDSVRLAALLSRLALERATIRDVLFEVNVGGEATKQGFAPDEIRAAAPALAALPGLRPRGLMTVAPAVPEPEAARPAFRQLRELRDQLAGSFGPDFTDLSMGMSHDYVVAISEGATIVRIGTAIFGPRGAPGGGASPPGRPPQG